MKKITYFWNHIFYNVWKFNCWTPFCTWLLKKEKVQKLYSKRNVSNIQKTHSDAISLVMLSFSYYTMLLITSFLFIPISMYVNRVFFTCDFILNNSFITILLFIVITMLPTYIINEGLIRWMSDGYISYFEIFEKESEKEKRKWRWITFFTIMLMLGVIVFGFIII